MIDQRYRTWLTQSWAPTPRVKQPRQIPRSCRMTIATPFWDAASLNGRVDISFSYQRLQIDAPYLVIWPLILVLSLKKCFDTVNLALQVRVPVTKADDLIPSE
jgi:hypothetical protein